MPDPLKHSSTEPERVQDTGRASLADQAYSALWRADPQAADLFDRAIQEEPERLDLVIGQAEARTVAGLPRPLEQLQRKLEAHPGWVAGHTALASLLWEQGEPSYAARMVEAVRRSPLHAELWNGLITTLAGSGDHTGAAEAAREAFRYFPVAALVLIEANQWGMAGYDDKVEELLSTVPEVSASRDQVEVRHRIRLNQLDAASAVADRMRAREPDDLSAWAVTELLWRALGDDRRNWLAGETGWVDANHLPLSEADLEELAAALRAMHWQSARPVGQSVRGGTQTRGRLFDRDSPQIGSLRVLLQAEVDAYRRRLPELDPLHPLLRHRDRPLQVDGGWSVRLTEGGFHVSHLHPAGVLSSAMYVSLPDLAMAPGEGSLELGRPPEDLRMALEPFATIKPRPGLLVLFPSFLYHGTRTFTAGERLTVAFDAS